MANSEDKESRDEIRVVDSEEEVIRLNEPSNKSIQKSGKPMVEPLVPAVPAGKESDGTGSGVPGEGALDLGDESLGEEVPAVPMGWFYLLGIGLVGIVVWMGFQIAFKEDSESLNDKGAGLVVGEDDNQDQEVSRIDAEKHFQEMEVVVSAFLAAENVEERVKYVRHPGRVRPLMEDFHESRPLRTYRYKRVKSYMTTSLAFKPFIALAVRTEEEGEIPILIEDSPEGLLVDWESFVCYQPVDPAKYVEERPTEPVSLRVYATPDNFYAYEFAEEREYLCFRLRFRDSEVMLFGYVKRGSKVEQKFRDVVAVSGFGASKPLILKVRFLEDGKADRGVLIEDLESTLWAFPENPEEEVK